jgi:hypothetical protein
MSFRSSFLMFTYVIDFFPLIHPIRCIKGSIPVRRSNDSSVLKTYITDHGLFNTADYPNIGTNGTNAHIHIMDAAVGQNLLFFYFGTLSHVQQKGNIISPFQNPSLVAATLFLYQRIKFDQRACGVPDEDCMGDIGDDGKKLIPVFMFAYTAFLVSSSTFC